MIRGTSAQVSGCSAVPLTRVAIGLRYPGRLPRSATTRREFVSSDPIAGDDEPWAAEDFLRPPDEEDFVAFFRSLTVALVVCLFVWLAIGGAAVYLYELFSG